MGRTDFFMHQRRIKNSETQKEKRDQINHVYQLGRLRARWSFGINSRKFWDKNATEKLIHNFAMGEVHQYLGHKWSQWERKWTE